MPVSTLILVRHAKSDWSGTEADIDRPLNDRGRQQAPLVGKWLNHHLPVIDRAVVSPAVRAQATWSLAAEELAVHPPAVTDVVKPRAEVIEMSQWRQEHTKWRP